MEIGGYFGLEKLISNEYHSGLIALNIARNAVAYLIRLKCIKKLYLPNFLCDSIYRICEKENCEYDFYEIDEGFQPIFYKQLLANEWIYIVNYYGQVTNEEALKRKYNRIIFDNVQAFFQKPVEGIDTLYSCRKFFGVPDGAYLSSDITMDLPDDYSGNRMEHILGRFEHNASDYYNSYTNNEETYYDLPVKSMSRITHNILGAIDYCKVKEIRERNFKYLHVKLGNINGLQIKSPIGPFSYPFYTNNGMKIKKALAKKGVYIATLWPSAISFGGIAKDYSENILPLPCDQRYDLEDMMRMVSLILEEIENNS